MTGNSYNVNDFLRAAQEQLNRYAMHRDRFDNLARETAQHQSDLKRKEADTLFAFASSLIPDFNDEGAINDLATRLGLGELRTLKARVTQQLATNARRKAEIEASQRYTRRDLELLQLQTKRDELEPLYRHAHDEWDRLQKQPNLVDLITRGYGTEQYAHKGWWRFMNPAYLADWQHADAACKALGFKSFPELRVAYNDRAEQMKVLGRDWNEMHDQKSEVAALEEEHDQMARSETELPREALRAMGERIAAVLDNGNSPLVNTLPDPDSVRGRLHEISGITAQIEYLGGLRVQLEKESSAITERADKLASEQSRYAEDINKYRNKSFTRDQWQKRFGDDRTARYEPLYGRYQRAVTTVYVFDDYNRVSGLETFLWWDIMTNGRMDGGFLPEVRDWRDQNPDYRYQQYGGGSYDPSGSGVYGSDNYGGTSGQDPS